MGSVVLILTRLWTTGMIYRRIIGNSHLVLFVVLRVGTNSLFVMYQVSLKF